MTAPQPATPDSDSVRAQIAEVLRQHAWEPSGGEAVRPGAPCMDCGEYPGARHASSLSCPRVLADALVPLVDRLRAEAKAEALEEAAKKIRVLADGPVPAINSAFDAVVILRASAAAHRTNPSSEETHRG